MILFLDFDGVLHPVPCKDKDLLCYIPRLEAVLREFPHVRVVISSAWRSIEPIEQLRDYFSHDIRARIIDVTPTVNHPAWDEDEADFEIDFSRCDEIMFWIRLNNYNGPWLALDDLWQQFPDSCLQLIRCETEIGFDLKVEAKLRDLLKIQSDR